MGKPPHSKYQRIERRQNEKSLPYSTNNQPTPFVFKIMHRWMYPKDKTAHYIVNVERKLGLDELYVIAEKLAKLYDMDVWVYESPFGSFEVYLDQPVSWQLIEECTLKVLIDD